MTGPVQLPDFNGRDTEKQPESGKHAGRDALQGAGLPPHAADDRGAQGAHARRQRNKLGRLGVSRFDGDTGGGCANRCRSFHDPVLV